MYKRTGGSTKTRVKNVNQKGGLKMGNEDLVKQEKAISLVKDEVKNVMKLLNKINIKCVKEKK